MLTRRSVARLLPGAMLAAVPGAVVAQTPAAIDDLPVARLIVALATGDVNGLEDYVRQDAAVPSDLVSGLDEFRFWIIETNARLQGSYTDIAPRIMAAFGDEAWSVVYAQVDALGRKTGMAWEHDWMLACEMADGRIRTVHAATSF